MCHINTSSSWHLALTLALIDPSQVLTFLHSEQNHVKRLLYNTYRQAQFSKELLIVLFRSPPHQAVHLLVSESLKNEHQQPALTTRCSRSEHQKPDFPLSALQHTEQQRQKPDVYLARLGQRAEFGSTRPCRTCLFSQLYAKYLHRKVGEDKNKYKSTNCLRYFVNIILRSISFSRTSCVVHISRLQVNASLLTIHFASLKFHKDFCRPPRFYLLIVLFQLKNSPIGGSEWIDELKKYMRNTVNK